MGKRFSIADYMPEGVSRSDTMEISMIRWDRIRVNDANFYDVSDVDELRNSIRMHGLLDPIVVTPDEEPEQYLLVSGHRRHKAWGMLQEEDPEKYALIPAIVRTFESKAMAELALIMANSTARKLSSAEISRQAERIERLLYDLKEEGYEFDGRMRDQVAKACQVSSTRLARLKVIRENLLIDFKKQWEAGKLNEACAYELAQGNSIFQARILRVQPTATSQGIAAVRKLMEAGNDYSCTSLCGPGCLKCTHQDAFLRHDLEDPWNPCEGKTCCLKCPKANRDWNPCSRMCSKAKAKRTEANAKAKEKQDREAQKKKDRLRQEIRESALRLLKAADAAGADDKTEIKLSGYGAKTVKWLRMAAGDGDIGYNYRNDIAPENLDVGKVALALGCSADYVCGLTEDLTPQAEICEPDTSAPAEWWQVGDPPGEGRYLCLVDLGTGTGDYHEQQCDFEDGIWKAYGRPVDDMFTVAAWYPLPSKWQPWMKLPEAQHEQ